MRKGVVAGIALLLLVPVAAVAQQKGGIELKSAAEVEVVQKDPNGVQVTRRVEAEKANVLPGDTVIFTVGYVNRGEEAATNVVIGNPVPQHMVYVDKSAQGAGARIEFSVDGGKSFAPLEQLTIKNASGLERPARAEDVTNVRWILARLEKGGTGSVSFRAKVK